MSEAEHTQAERTQAERTQVEHTQAFEQLRPMLTGMAYRMLGSLAEAEDMVQETYLRWHASAGRISAGRTSAGRTSAGRTSAGHTSAGHT